MNNTAYITKPNKKDVERFLNQDLFTGLSDSVIQKIFAKCKILQLEQGDIALSPGEANHYLYLVLSGSLLVFLDEIESKSSFTIQEGEYIGEMSIIEGHVTSAYVVAKEKCRLIEIHEDLFWDEIASHRRVLRNMLTLFSQRIRKQNEVTKAAIEKQLRYEHLQQDLAAAGKIQANILPQESPLFPDYPQIDVCAIMKPAREVGGDFYDAFAIDDEHICIAVGDVSGKGLPSAMFMVRVITLLRMSLVKKKNFKSVMSKVNRLLCKNNHECNFVTIFLGMLNVKTGQLKYFNGGHNAPFIAKADRPFDLLAMPSGTLLGFSEQVVYDLAEIQLAANDTIVLYTDGITEAQNHKQELFGIERARVVLNEADANNVHDLVKQMRKQVKKFSKKIPQSDDITLLALRYHGDISLDE